MDKNARFLSLRIPPEVHRALKLAVKRPGDRTTVNGYIVQAIERYLIKDGFEHVLKSEKT